MNKKKPLFLKYTLFNKKEKFTLITDTQSDMSCDWGMKNIENFTFTCYQVPSKLIAPQI